MEASRTVLDVIQHAKCNGPPLLVISTDFSKALDSITHDPTEENLLMINSTIDVTWDVMLKIDVTNILDIGFMTIVFFSQ